MISRLAGMLLVIDPPLILVDVHGVGYEIEAPNSTFQQLPRVGEAVVLHTHLIVREDAQVLCGFATVRERELFRHLIKVNGVGPKLALAILSGMDGDEFVRCIRDNNALALTRISGVGKKTAERLLVEMRDRLDHWEIAPAATATQTATPLGAVNEAMSALLALGYKSQEITRLLQQLDTQGKNSETIIRAALKLAAAR
ncbi:MAG: Holliday junction branch migration protein RuvA [Gammaproteobacteria bacterium]|nr:Holliday junction branch migration protein RuvA [Gammaproteobacteria bacterium]